jgi:hypothetical protein
MRLSPENLALLQATVRRFFGAEAAAYLYGSRLAERILAERKSLLEEKMGLLCQRRPRRSNPS